MEGNKIVGILPKEDINDYISKHDKVLSSVGSIRITGDTKTLEDYIIFAENVE